MDGDSKGGLLSFSGRSSSTPWSASRLNVRPLEVADLIVPQPSNHGAIHGAVSIVDAGIVPTV